MAKEFNPYGDVVAIVDQIEKAVGISDATMSHEGRMSTGVLTLDLVLNGGIAPGWYTNFGMEQCCKSTLAMTMLMSSLKTDVPFKAYYDYEGCVVGSTRVFVNGQEFTFDDLAHTYRPGDVIPLVNTAGGKVDGRLFDGGQQPTVEMELEDGRKLEGAKHPVLVWNEATEEAEWVLIEDVKAGDTVLVYERAS